MTFSCVFLRKFSARMLGVSAVWPRLYTMGLSARERIKIHRHMQPALGDYVKANMVGLGEHFPIFLPRGGGGQKLLFMAPLPAYRRGDIVHTLVRSSDIDIDSERRGTAVPQRKKKPTVSAKKAARLTARF